MLNDEDHPGIYRQLRRAVTAKLKKYREALLAQAAVALPDVSFIGQHHRPTNPVAIYEAQQRLYSGILITTASNC